LLSYVYDLVCQQSGADGGRTHDDELSERRGGGALPCQERAGRAAQVDRDEAARIAAHGWQLASERGHRDANARQRAAPDSSQQLSEAAVRS
jgi:hypothetical protein